MPYKKEVIPFCKTLSPLAKRIGSVNTLKACDDGLYGYNTDYFGFCYMLAKGNIPIRGEKCAVIGNGGVSATVRVALQDLGASQITVITRALNNPAFINSISDHTVVINTTPVGMYPDNGSVALDLRQFCCLKGVADLIYNPLKTALMLQAEELGVPCIGGLSMLVAQAKQAAEIFEEKILDDALIEKITHELELQCRNMILIGMPGCGKSTIGKALADRLGQPFFDTDRLIEETVGKTIPQIFDEDGEAYFRQIESSVLKDISAKSGVVIATGGGIVKEAVNHLYLKQNGFIVFLDRPIEMLCSDGRPLSSSREAIVKLYEERLLMYKSLANTEVNNDSTIENVLQRILYIIDNADHF